MGIILFIICCGQPPFLSKDKFELFEMIKSGKFEFKQKQWENISKEMKHLICGLLTVDPDKRIKNDEI